MDSIEYGNLKNKIAVYLLEHPENEDMRLLFRIYNIYMFDCPELLNRFNNLMIKEDDKNNSDWYNYMPDKEADEETKQIGKDAERIGGMPLMQALFYIYINFIADNEFKRCGCQNLNYLWSGIGHWQA